MRHLTLDQAAAALRRGKPVEQLLASRSGDEPGTLRWATVIPTRDGFVVRAHYVYDQGGADFRDLSAFSPVDADEEAGEGVEIARHVEPEAALLAAADHGALNERWVNFGLIADEYSDYRGWS